MANITTLGTSGLDSNSAMAAVDRMQQLFSMQRKPFERRWYDNNFFDDGFHFRYVSRATGKIVDANEHSGLYDPKRAIPKASRQIRGVANLLAQADYVPVIYPETSFNYSEEQKKVSLDIAQKIGSWIKNEWKDQELTDKIVQMILLAAKNSVSFMQVWPDENKQKIQTKVYDAFDIYLQGQLTEIYDSPVIIKVFPMLINPMLTDEHYPEEQRAKLSADNKYASSEIKEAYMRARFGFNTAANDATATGLFKEAYIKEYIDDKNLAVIKEQDNAQDVLAGKKMGDCVIRQLMGMNGVWLKDLYTDLTEYNFVDFRFEPGPIYQTSFMERFIPTNKSLDTLMSRLEKYANTMVTGTWMKRKGENFDITNISGAQVINYDSTPPIQGQMASIPSFYFEAIGLLNSFIDEQGVPITSAGRLPQGVESRVAIESMKETEYANLKIPTNQVKKTIRRTTEKMMDIADKYFIDPQEVQIMDEGNPVQFKVIGNRGKELMQSAEIDTSGMVAISKDYKVDIEVETGAAYTYEGKKELINGLVDRLVLLSKEGMVSPEAIKLVVKKLMEIYKLGSTAEFMEAMDKLPDNTTEMDLEKMKIALATVIKDLGMVGDQATQQHIDETKVGVVEATKDMGLLDKQPEQEKEPSKSISFKDLPPQGQAQLAAQAGIQITPEQVQQQTVQTQQAQIQQAAQLAKVKQPVKKGVK